jgi:RNA polymerase sigma factor (sigma-70 family)
VSHDGDRIEDRLLAGDSVAIGIVSRWIAPILTSSRFWSIRREWPDLHQDVMSRVVESLKQKRFDPQRDFRKYVQGIARNTARRTRARRVEVPLDSIPERTAKSGTAQQAEARMFARSVLDGATPSCRELMRLYFLEQMDYDKIAEALGLPVGTVKSRLFRCLACARRESAPGVPRARSDSKISMRWRNPRGAALKVDG